MSVDVEEDAIIEAAVDRILFGQNRIDVGAVDFCARGNRIVRDTTPHTRFQTHTVLRDDRDRVVQENRHGGVQAAHPCSRNLLVDVDRCAYVDFAVRRVRCDQLTRDGQESFEIPFVREPIDTDDLA